MSSRLYALLVATAVLTILVTTFAGLYLTREKENLWPAVGLPDVTEYNDEVVVIGGKPVRVNVRITCQTYGSRLVDGKREPLEMDTVPAPGDHYRRECIGEQP